MGLAWSWDGLMASLICGKRAMMSAPTAVRLMSFSGVRQASHRLVSGSAL